MPGYIEPNMRLLSKRVGFKIALFLFLEDFFSISFIIMLRIPGLKRFIPPIRHVRFYHGKEGGRSSILARWNSRGRQGIAFLLGIGGSLLAWSSLSYGNAQEDLKENHTVVKSPDDKITKSEFEKCCCNGSNAKKKRKWKKTIEKSLLKLEQIKEETGSPGLICAVSVDGEMVWNAALGFADVENGVKCHKATLMRIASISKALTSIALGKLLQENKLELDVPIQKYVDYFPEKTFNGDKVIITPRMLMSHTSGVRHYDKELPKKNDETSEQTNTDSSGKEKSNSKGKEKSEEERKSEKVNDTDEFKLKEYYIKDHYDTIKDAINLFSEDPLLEKPGTNFLYTTHGWTLLSACVEMASGMDYVTYMKKMCYELGLDNTMVELNDPILYDRSRNYTRDSKGKLQNTPYVDNSYKWAGGGFLSNIEDLLKIGNVMLYSHLEKQDTTSLKGYLDQDVVRQLWTPDPVTIGKVSKHFKEMGYGLGWSLLPNSSEYGCCRKSKFAAMHGGGAVGASSILLIVPTEPTSEAESTSQASNGTEVEQNSKVKNAGQRAEVKVAGEKEYERGVSMNQSSNTFEPKPRGVVVAIMVNLQNVSLAKTALEIAEVFSTQDF